MSFDITFARLGATRWTGGSDLVDPGDIATEILPGLRGGQLFAYLFRRFGYPNPNWDSRKNLVSYALSTPDPNVILLITPSMAGDHMQQQDPMYVALMFQC